MVLGPFGLPGGSQGTVRRGSMKEPLDLVKSPGVERSRRVYMYVHTCVHVYIEPL